MQGDKLGWIEKELDHGNGITVFDVRINWQYFLWRKTKFEKSMETETLVIQGVFDNNWNNVFYCNG